MKDRVWLVGDRSESSVWPERSRAIVFVSTVSVSSSSPTYAVSAGSSANLRNETGLNSTLVRACVSQLVFFVVCSLSF